MPTEPLIYDPHSSGVRKVQLTKKAFPVGYVAFCNPCAWSTGICLGTTEFPAWERAAIKLVNHKKTEGHKRVTHSQVD